jgi:hypothetical protein
MAFQTWMHTSKNGKISIAIFVLCILLLLFATNPFKLYFLNDDFIHIPIASKGIFGHHNSLRHVNDFSLYLDYLWSNNKAWGYHFTNLVLHLSNIFLAVPLIKKLYNSLLNQHLPTSFILLPVALFAIYAFHSEAVFWILCRTASLSFFFILLSWLCFFKVKINTIWLIPCVVFFLLGIFTYESVWVYPILLLIWYLLLPNKNENHFKFKLPIVTIWVLFLLYFPFRFFITKAWLGAYEAADIEKLNWVALILKSSKLFFRSFLPPINNQHLFVTLSILICISVASILVYVIVKKLADKFLIFITIAWLLSYLPYISLGISTSGYESERYLYFSSFFLCIVIIYLFRLLILNSMLFWFCIVAVFAYHLFFFMQSSINYKAMGHTAKSSIEAIQAIPTQKKIVIKQLPIYHLGIPVFNYGFSNAMQWMVPQRDTSTIEIMSKAKFEKGEIYIQKITENPLVDTIIFTGSGMSF